MKKSCLSLEELILFHDGEADPPLRKAIEGHLEKCSSCRQRFHRILELDCLLKRGDPALASKDRVEEGIPAFPAAPSVQHPRQGKILSLDWRVWGGAAACFLIALICLYFVLFHPALWNREREVGKGFQREPKPAVKEAQREVQVPSPFKEDEEKRREELLHGEGFQENGVQRTERLKIRREEAEKRVRQFLERLSKSEEMTQVAQEFKQCDEAVLSSLLRIVGKGEDPLLNQAISLVAAMKEIRAVDNLIALAVKGKKEREVIEALGEIGYPKALPFLEKMALENVWPREALLAIAAVERRRSTKVLEGLARKEELRDRVLEVLCEIGGREGSEAVVRIAFAFPESSGVLQALNRLKEHTGSILLDRLKEKKDSAFVVSFVGNLREQRAVGELFSMAKAGRNLKEAVLALGRIGGERGTEALLYLVDRIDPSLLAPGLSELGEEEIANLQEKVMGRNRYLGEKALRALGMLQKRELLPFFAILIREDRFQEEAVGAICRTDGEEALAVLEPLLADPERGSRVVQAAAQEEGETALRILCRAAEVEGLEKKAFSCLAKRSDAAQAVPALIQLLEKRKGRGEVVKALARIGDPRGLEALKQRNIPGREGGSRRGTDRGSRSPLPSRERQAPGNSGKPQRADSQLSRPSGSVRRM